jgi:hypothetical protein
MFPEAAIVGSPELGFYTPIWLHQQFMIVFVTTRGHSYTIAPLMYGTFDFGVPKVRAVAYDDLFRARKVPSATYVFTDFERLSSAELHLAAQLYRGLGETGLKLLNDPARVLGRYQLLRSLHRAGFNPFNAYRADDEPQPKRFPVILRREFDHQLPQSHLIQDQKELERTLSRLREDGTPLRGWIVIEFCAEPIAPDMWAIFGTFRIGDAMHLDHGVVENDWRAKYGTPGLATEDIIREFVRSMDENAFADAIRPAFELANIEYGRADHAPVGGRHVVYEINTNPTIRGPRVSRSPLYTEALTRSRERLARLLWTIDTGDGRKLSFPRSKRLDNYRRDNFWTRPPLLP